MEVGRWRGVVNRVVRGVRVGEREGSEREARRYLFSGPSTTHSLCTFVEDNLSTTYSNVSCKRHTMGGCIDH